MLFDLGIDNLTLIIFITGTELNIDFDNTLSLYPVDANGAASTIKR